MDPIGWTLECSTLIGSTLVCKYETWVEVTDINEPIFKKPP